LSHAAAASPDRAKAPGEAQATRVQASPARVSPAQAGLTHASPAQSNSARRSPAQTRPAFLAAQASRLRSMTIWIGLGAALAIAIVVAAFLLRPGAAPETADAPAEGTAAMSTESPAPAPPGVSGEQPVSVPEASRPLADPALAGVDTVRLRIGPEIADERRNQLAAALTQAGIPNVVVEQLPFRIATSRIGYYRDEDRAAAEALARVISPAVAEGDAIGVRDYGELLSDPQPGRLDLWIGG
jgi:hypothetical protein